MQSKASLVEIVDRLNEIEQHGELLSADQKEEAKHTLTKFFTGQPDYLGFTIPSYDFEAGGRLFTGERLRTRMGIHTVLSLEVCRAILAMNGLQEDLKPMMAEIDERLVMKCYVKDDCVMGECAFAALAFWRYLLVSEWPDREYHVKNFIRLLRENRDGAGAWKHFPFYYTLFVLQETQLPQARQELVYALPACNLRLADLVIAEPFKTRRKMLLDFCVFSVQTESTYAWRLGI